MMKRAATLIFTQVRVTKHATFLSPFTVRAYSTSNTLIDKLHEHWTPAKTDVVTQRDLKLDPIPSTRFWTEKELEFFRLHYCHVKDASLWPSIFCDEAPLTAKASDLVNMDLTAAEIVEGEFVYHFSWLLIIIKANTRTCRGMWKSLLSCCLVPYYQTEQKRSQTT
jgi:hypothetical protein